LVIKQPEMNVLAVTAEVEAARRAVVRARPAGVRVEESMFRQASFVTHALGNLRRALLAGVVLVIVVLVLFTGSQRAALVSVVAIPLSLLAAVAVLRAAGATLNVMVLGGLAIAVGEVVDDAIIDVENAWRRLRAAPAGARAADVVLAASLALTPLLRLEFLPEFHETNFVMHMTGAPGVGLDESARVGAATARTLLAVPGVRSVAQVIGRSTLSEDTFGPERSEMMVQLEPGADAVAVTAELRGRGRARAARGARRASGRPHRRGRAAGGRRAAHRGRRRARSGAARAPAHPGRARPRAAARRGRRRGARPAPHRDHARGRRAHRARAPGRARARARGGGARRGARGGRGAAAGRGLRRGGGRVCGRGRGTHAPRWPGRARAPRHL